MHWPDAVEILRATLRTSTATFLVTAEVLLLPPAPFDVKGDRVRVNGALYSVRAADEIRSPSRRALWRLTVQPTP